ncbi:sigma-70 family RNA polymerase sigma factor [Salibacterium salarium]|nr:sigma-70 family RNA polymerase sigma factor [Salibacterium salarium]
MMLYSDENLILKYRSLVTSISSKFSRRGNIPYEDFESNLLEELWESIKHFDADKECSLKTWVNIRLRQRSIDMIRDSKEKTYYERFHHYSLYAETDEDTGLESLLEEKESAEQSVIYKNKEADQRQLIDFLCDPDKVTDPTTTAIVAEFSQHDSITALGKALGIHHETIKRKLRRLSRNFDSDKFGDFKDYLSA